MSGTWQSLKKQTCGLFSIVAFAYMVTLDFSLSMEQVSTAMVIYIAALYCCVGWSELCAQAVQRQSSAQDLLHA